ncbi:MAG: hypothetical protein E6X23_20975 [Mixta calida]|uniref:hypothetical protein n=1 Tax=Mixta calida TaxID=665913 RepID=UPI00291532CE|nr:hypothetical protein [Mixta calida]MDU4943966.1 hypothetical protein [Mixta calida]
MRKYQRRLKTEAGRIQEGWKLEFEGGIAMEVTEVRHLGRRTLFRAGGTPWSLEYDDIVYRVIDMELVEGVGK